MRTSSKPIPRCPTLPLPPKHVQHPPRCPPLSLPPKHPQHPPRCPPGLPGLEQLKHLRHNEHAARNLKGAIQDKLKLVRFGAPLSKAESPRMGPNGQMVAPNGNPLIRVKLSEGSVLGESQYALVDPKTNQFYVQNNAGGFAHPTTYNGPLSLPPEARFEGKKFTPADLKRFERLANTPSKFPFPMDLASLKYDQPAPKASEIASEKLLKSEHPFTYYAVTLKDDPKHVIIKKVLTGGFVPAQPGDGSYSAPIAIN